jgi:hypothetical protein
MQMITNFIWSSSGDYSSTNFSNPTPQPRPLRDGGNGGNAGNSPRKQFLLIVEILATLAVMYIA